MQLDYVHVVDLDIGASKSDNLRDQCGHHFGGSARRVCAPDIARILRRAMKDGHQALKEARGRSDGANGETLSL